MFHIGHFHMLKRLSKRGNKLIVVVSTDEFNLGKGKKTVIACKDSKKIIKVLKCVDKVIREKSWEQK